MPPSFNAVRQFTVVPDRYYQIEIRQHGLRFTKTGSQFDDQHAGSMGRGKMEHAGGQPVPVREDGRGIELSKSAMILGGIALLVVSVVLMLVTAAKAGKLVFGFVGLAAFGGVLLLAGLVKPGRRALAERPHDFEIQYLEIRSAVLELPKRQGAVAKLKLVVNGERKPINLAIKTMHDLAMVQNSVMPLLGPSGRIV